MDAREGFMTPAAFAKLVRAMPEAEASEHFGTPDDRVGGKIFATAGRVDGRAVLKLTPDQQAMLCEAEPALFEPIAGGWGRKGWTNLILAKADAKTAKSAIWMAWRKTAPKKLFKAHAA